MTTRPLIMLLVLAGGCATTGLPPCPREGGPPWRIIESEHFDVYTDAGSARAADLAADLEFTRAALAQLLAPGWAGPRGRIPVLLLSGKRHFATFFPPGVEGGFTEVLMPSRERGSPRPHTATSGSVGTPCRWPRSRAATRRRRGAR
jgi:hypothetical protein